MQKGSALTSQREPSVFTLHVFGHVCPQPPGGSLRSASDLRNATQRPRPDRAPAAAPGGRRRRRENAPRSGSAPRPAAPPPAGGAAATAPPQRRRSRGRVSKVTAPQWSCRRTRRAAAGCWATPGACPAAPTPRCSAPPSEACCSPAAAWVSGSGRRGAAWGRRGRLRAVCRG